ncbi:group I intron-associated PD-(D/E)XK endonuclease [Roseisolibacter sp. H3M3-2]|uniref:group I intron-associated PD-(D/E)XK endonuclease n=1 Tax=Roseisolibacter sp. H3M3-2 TaxID=3031323 RepID=UPI0023DCA42C|nr:group I intron-associated PD-(D/E)XK endonuclease [Roseisolibacter sp. H3M3-2]MDF1502076.1 group I intron-associated PD-(D/E)XK endonuclease [Roseisolibacter sp. H3M3-2]
MDLRVPPNPKTVGERSEVFVLAALVRAGYEVLIAPFTDNRRYDLVIDDGSRFLRVQVKTGRLRGGAVIFPTSSSQAHRGRGRQSYRGACDLFAVYCPDNEAVYLVPVDEVGEIKCRLRVAPAANGQRAGVRLAEDYLLRLRAPAP